MPLCQWEEVLKSEMLGSVALDLHMNGAFVGGSFLEERAHGSHAHAVYNQQLLSRPALPSAQALADLFGFLFVQSLKQLALS